MADALFPTPTRLALLADIAAGKVADNDDGTPMLDLGEEGHCRVADAVWLMYQAGWIYQADGHPGWQLTPTGRDVLQGRTGDG